MRNENCDNAKGKKIEIVCSVKKYFYFYVNITWSIKQKNIYLKAAKEENTQQLKYIQMYQVQTSMKFLIHLMKWTSQIKNNKEIYGIFFMY